ncbi:MAG: CoA-binding protein [Bacteroidota bacterium]
MKKKTLVLGASPNPARYGYMATEMLTEYEHEVVPYGIKKGEINGKPMVNELPEDKDFDTVTLYLNPTNQREYYDYIIGLHPKRVVFNPGTENPEFEQKLIDNGIQPLQACTLVLLRTGQY